MTGNGGEVLKNRLLLLLLLAFLQVFGSRDRVVKLSDVFLEPPAVGLLGFQNFELPAVGLPELRKHLTGTTCT
jgi:hypothetical protein